MTIHPLGPDEPGTIGRYRVLGTLDPAPGFRAVLAAGPDDSLVVVRQAEPELLGEPEFRVRLRHSAVAGMRVAGAGNTTVLDVDADADRPWLAAAFVPGVRLDSAVAEHGPLPTPAVRALAAALATALRTVHEAGLVHQRLRADTVLLAREGGRLGEIGMTPAAAPGTTGTATTVGTPDFLSPEQTLGHALTPASDVFSFGSVLAFAAGGVAPFAAPSVPYAMYNIAQRAPDLSRVPAELRELIAPCLHKDPAARPTPAQILDYLGNPAPTPPPWPAPILDDIDRQQAEVSALLAALAPPAAPTSRLMEQWSTRLAALGPAALEIGRRAVRSGQRRWQSATSGARIGFAAGLAVLLLVVGGVTAFALRPAEEPAPVTALTLAQLRQIDACAWLTTAVGDSVPVAPTPLPAQAWRIEPTETWGCAAFANRYAILLSLGSVSTKLTPHEVIVDGVPVIYGHEVGCTRAIAGADDKREAGIEIMLLPPSDVQGCDGIDHVAANIARTLTTAPTAEDRQTRLALLDPCELLDRDVVTEKIGVLAPEPTIAAAHTCQWDARVELGLRLVRVSQLTGPDAESTEVDGISMYPDRSLSRSTCTRAYLVPDFDRETVEVEVRGMDGGRDEYCALAATFLRQAIDNLPAR
ncbi:protein kinase [Nocardia sp. NPDC058176]|uniref:protein kinase domain-containing protein n=1 Tax=Nocardia sp. NPDC058176 TaxID=3346368 RepID=UPI0036DF5768